MAAPAINANAARSAVLLIQNRQPRAHRQPERDGRRQQRDRGQVAAQAQAEEEGGQDDGPE